MAGGNKRRWTRVYQPPLFADRLSANVGTVRRPIVNVAFLTGRLVRDYTCSTCGPPMFRAGRAAEETIMRDSVSWAFGARRLFRPNTMGASGAGCS